MPLKFYALDCAGKRPAVSITLKTPYNGMPWQTGEERMSDIEVPVRFAFDPGMTGNLKSFYDSAIPLMSDALIAALKAGGAENLEIFPAIITDGSGKEFPNYKAVNILGLAESPEHAQKKKLPIFRSEASSEVIVTEKIKKALEKAGLQDIEFNDDLENSL